MYAGHAGLALYAKQLRPRVPMAVLVPVAFAPDWIQWALIAVGGVRNPSISHSLVSVVAGAFVVAGAYWAVTKSRDDAAIVCLTYLSHWPADFITAKKAFWPNSPEVGLNLYQHPVADVVVEAVVIVLCWLAYRRSLPPDSRRNPIGLAIPIGLIGLQIGFVLIQNPAVHEPLRQMMEIMAN
ncbi:MAG: metal-dependent hydrolase [Gemmatimonadaceae bacterium]